MNLSEFIAFHRTTLELDEVKHGLILNGLAQAVRAKALDLSCRTLGEPGQCAIKMAHHSIVVGAVEENQCRRLAE